MKTPQPRIGFVLTLLASLVFASWASAGVVVLKVVDQYGQEIPGSQINVLSQTINTGDSLLLPDGIHTFAVIPGVPGGFHQAGLSLSRAEIAAVTGTTTELLFEWITSEVTLRLHDQAGVDIPGSRIFLGPGRGWGELTGVPVTLPITDENVYANLQGGLANGYTFYPAPGVLGSGYWSQLERPEIHEILADTTELSFEWRTATVVLRVHDQAGVDIPGSRIFLGPSRLWGGLTGEPVTLPITDESVYANLQGELVNGYTFYPAPGSNGASWWSWLERRTEKSEVLANTSEIAFEWITAEVTLRLQDQHGVEIAGSRFTVGPGTFNGGLLTGDTAILPITDISVYPTIEGQFADGHDFDLLVRVGGTTHPAWLMRQEFAREVTAATTEIVYEWIQHSCALELRGANGQPIPGSSFVLPPGFGPVLPGDAPAFPVNDLGSYPTATGLLTSGYAITVTPGDIAPASATVYLTVNAGGDFSPATFNVGGNTYRLACSSCAADNVPPTLTCAPDLVIVSDRAACGEHDHDDDDWEHHHRDGRQRDEHEDHGQCRGHHGHDDHDAHGYTCRFWNRCVATGVTLTAPTVTDNCTVASVAHNHPFSTYPLGVTPVTWTATDAAGNVSTCVQKVTVVPSVEVSFRSPLARKPTHNTIRRGQTVPFKVELEDCLDQAVRTGVTVKLQVQGIESGTGDVFQDVIEEANGLGTDGTLTSDGLMQLRNSQWQFNLDTGNFGDPNTVVGSRFYRATVTVMDNATLAVLGVGTVNLETGRR